MTDPTCRPHSLAACAFMTASSVRCGSARRPSTRVTRSMVRYSSPPITVGGVSPAPMSGCVPLTALRSMLPSKPREVAECSTWGRCAIASTIPGLYPVLWPRPGSSNPARTMMLDGLVLAR